MCIRIPVFVPLSKSTMTYNLTEKQKELARWLVGEHHSKRLGDAFRIQPTRAGIAFAFQDNETFPYDDTGIAALRAACPSFDPAALDALAAEGFLHEAQYCGLPRFTFTRRIFDAVRSGFADEPTTTLLSTLAHAAPPELNLSLDRLRKQYPDPAKLGFLIMRFTPGRVFGAIVAAIQETAAKYGIAIVRADQHNFHANLWENVQTFLHGCSFGVTVYERIEQDEPNANVGLEVGYLLAMNKPVLLLKERTVKTLQADLMGKLYKEFDEHDAAGTIPVQLERWLIDNGVIV